MAPGSASITVDGSDEELRQLANWLRDENDLRGRVHLSEAPIQDGHMGATLDAIVVVLTSTTATTLIKSIKEWLIARRSAQKVTLKLKGSSGNELELTCGSAEDADLILTKAREFVEEP